MSIIVLLFAAVLTLPALGAPAATPKVNKQPVVAPSASAVKTIWDYQKEIGFTNDQGAQMKAALGALGQNVKDLQAKREPVVKELQGLLTANAPLDQIKAKIMDFYSIQADLTLADLETARKINAILTKEQLDKWRAIQAKARAQKS